MTHKNTFQPGLSAELKARIQMERRVADDRDMSTSNEMRMRELEYIGLWLTKTYGPFTIEFKTNTKLIIHLPQFC